MRKALFLFILYCGSQPSFAQNSNYPDPIKNPLSSLMLDGDWVPENTHDIDFFALPKVPSEDTIVSDVRYAWGRKTNQHNYLVYFDGMVFTKMGFLVGNWHVDYPHVYEHEGFLYALLPVPNKAWRC